MRTEIHLSASSTTARSVYVWRVWDKGQIVANGISTSEDEANEAARIIRGADAPRERPFGGGDPTR